MGAYQELSNKIFEDIVKVAKDLNYSESNILILDNKETELKENFPEVYNNLLSCGHNRDGRTPFEYAQDLVASWLFEDCLVDTLNKNGIEVSLSGADKNREILSRKNVSSKSDTLITYNGKERKLELMSDYKGYWKKYKRIDLRDDKYTELKKSNSLFLGISTSDNSYIIIDFSKDVKSKYTNYHPPFRKPCYFINIDESNLKKYDIKEIVNDLKKLIK